MRASLRSRRALGGAASIALLAIAATACGGNGSVPIRIGFFSDCKGLFATNYEQAVAGAELPFRQRGAKPLGPRPSDGLGGVSIGGKQVELVVGCDFGGSLVSTLHESRRLVEQEGASILVTPITEEVSREYAERQRSIAFVATGLSQYTTLVDPMPNIFRFNADTTQGMAGLGAYAYHDLGWRTAAVFGEDGPFGWSIAAGFVTEFCALGGT